MAKYVTHPALKVQHWRAGLYSTRTKDGPTFSIKNSKFLFFPKKVIKKISQFNLTRNQLGFSLRRKGGFQRGVNNEGVPEDGLLIFILYLGFLGKFKKYYIHDVIVLEVWDPFL